MFEADDVVHQSSGKGCRALNGSFRYFSGNTANLPATRKCCQDRKFIIQPR
jgi:hypothetical protein